MLAQRLQTALRVIYPARCLTCDGLVESDFGLCGPCWRATSFVAGLVCDLCGVPLPGTSDQVEHCDDCLTIARPWVQGRAALIYKDTGRRLVLSLKHGDRHDVVGPAALWMARTSRPMLRPDMIVVPIPLHPFRLLKRRYNQSALLAQALARQLGCDWCPDALQRIRHTPSLEGKSRDDRFATLDAALRPNPRRRDTLKGRPVLLVDDVMTTGATFAAATDACHAAGAMDVCVTMLARVAKDT